MELGQKKRRRCGEFGSASSNNELFIGLPAIDHSVPLIAAAASTTATSESVEVLPPSDSDALRGLPSVQQQDKVADASSATAALDARSCGVGQFRSLLSTSLQGLPVLRQGDTAEDASSATAAAAASSEWRLTMAVPSGIPRGLTGVHHALVQEERLRAWLKCSTPLWLRVVRETLGEFTSSTPLRVMHDCEGINSPGEALRLLRLHGCFDHREEMVAVSDIAPACRRWNLLHHTQPKVSFTDMLQRDFARGGASLDAFTGARTVAVC